MKMAGTLRVIALASVATIALVGCSDTTIDSPGAPTPVAPAPAPPPSPPPPPAASTIGLVPAAGCPTGTTQITLAAVAADGFSSTDVCALGATGGQTTISSNITIPANTTIALQGPVFIGADGGANATVTVGAGVRFFGASTTGSANATDDYLVVTRGSQLVVNGTEANPVRMTARAAINDEETGSRTLAADDNGLWGGLVINGFAPINDCADATATGGTAGCEKSGEGASGLFGGSNPADTSGTYRYLIVEYAGSRLTNDDELNGIAFQGVGNGTTAEYLQVHNNLDDGIEWFGGTVNVRYAAVTGAGNNSIDWTDGWSGSLQFAAVRSTLPSSDDPRGIEGDNQRPTDKTPFSNPTISNFTMIGTAGNQQGILLRRGTKGRIINGVVTGFQSGIDVDDAQTFTNIANSELQIASILFDVPTVFDQDSDPLTAAQTLNVRIGNNSLVDRFFPGQAERNVPVQTPPSNGFLDTTVNYVGAFSPTETASSSWANFTLPGTLFEQQVAACPTGTVDAGEITAAGASAAKKLCQINGTNALTSNLTLSNGAAIVYELVNPVFVGVDQGPNPAAPVAGSASATLTIEPGVTVVADGNDDYLVIARGSRIVSNGTANRPVVMTSKGVYTGATTATKSTKGIWGGVVINGRAPINDCADSTATGGTVGCVKSGEGASGLFGGASPFDDSGQLFYTRVEYAGVRLTNDDELNGIAFQGVGSQTEASFLQVYNNLDDCFEWFGGTVSVDHIIALGCGDDSIDWTDGWTGSAQYAIVYPGEGDMSDDPRGIEGDNQRPNDKMPISDPKISNFTVINSGDPAVDAGAVIRRGTRGTIVNGIIVGFPTGLDVDDAATIANFNNGSLRLTSIFLDNVVEVRQDSDIPNYVDTTATPLNLPNTLSGFSFRAGRQGVVPGDNENGVPVFDVTGVGTLRPTTYIGAVQNANDTWFRGWSVDENGNLVSQ